MFLYTNNIIWFNLKENKNYYPKILSKKCYFMEDIDIFCSNPDEEYKNVFLNTLKK